MSPSDSYKRVAVVQLAYHPAGLFQRRSPREDPLFDPKRPGDSLLPSHNPETSALREQLRSLRQRIREAHDAQLLLKVRAILEACKSWGVELVVFPEYSIPWNLLEDIATAAEDMSVVAGTHTVDLPAHKSSIYAKLHAPAEPDVGQAVCPVLHHGRLLSLQPKLNPAKPEQGSMEPGETWTPVEVEGFPGPMGVLICLDFLYQHSERHQRLVTPWLEKLRFLAVPSLTPYYSLPEFDAKAWEAARRYKLPVLYCDGADGGGTTLYVDEGPPEDLRRFPDKVGYLEPGDEGVIVADVNLGMVRPGDSTPYHAPPDVRPVAEASLVYRTDPTGQAYARWLEEAALLLAGGNRGALAELAERIRKQEDILLNAGAVSGAKARGRRLGRLVEDIHGERVTRLEDLRRFTREVLLPEQVLPPSALRAAMARGAADAIFAWLERREARAAGFGEVEARLRKASESLESARAWTDEARQQLGAIAAKVRGPLEHEPSGTPPPEPRVKVVLPSGLEPSALGIRTHEGWVLSFQKKPGDFLPRRDVGRRGELNGSALELTEARIEQWEQRFLLAIAKGAERAAALAVWREESPQSVALLIIYQQEGKWTLWSDGRDTWLESKWQSFQETLLTQGLEAASPQVIPQESLPARAQALLPRFDGARGIITNLREQLLREVQGQFVEPDVRIDGGEPVPFLKVCEAWLDSPAQAALLLGEFGSGKSTALAEWAWRRGESGATPRLVLANIAGASTNRDAEALLLEAAALDDVPAHRAALRVLIRHRLLVPCFDGFDEMATRIDASELAGRLSELLALARDGGKVLVSSRSHYFSTEAHLQSTVTEALGRALGQASGLQRMVLEPLTDSQIQSLVHRVLGNEAEEALNRIAHTYDLRDLVHRPLLLGMVLNTLDQLKPGAKVGKADLYEGYLQRWLDQTRSREPDCFSDDQKKSFAESLAESLWRSGEPNCTWEELRRSVMARLVEHLPDSMPVGAALLEIQGGAFFVREGEDRYRFAHKSFLEYFLARALVHTLPERPLEALRTRPLTQEISEFVGEILRREGEVRTARAIRKVQRFLTEDREQGHAVVASEAGAEAAANALRLLRGLARWSGDNSPWIPEGANLRGVLLVGEDLRGLGLVKARLEGALLSGADLTGANLSAAKLDRARLVGARLYETQLVSAEGYGADFTLAEADQVNLEGTDLRGATLRQSMWTRCRWEKVQWEGADMTAWCAPAGSPPQERALSITRSGMEVTLTEGGHTRGVNAVAWHPEGRRLASASDDGTVRLWDPDTGRELAVLRGHEQTVWDAAWAPEGHRLASASADGTVRLWDPDTGRELAVLEGHDHWVRAVAWHPEGRRLASASADCTVRLWDPDTGRELSVLRGHKRAVLAVTWAPKGRRLASTSADGTIRLWDSDTGRELAVLRGHKQAVLAVAWDPEGHRLASASDDGTVRLWNPDTGHELSVLQGHERWVRAVAWDPEGRRLASASDDGTVRLWDPNVGRELAILRGHEHWVWAVAWHPEGRRLASASADGSIRLWDPYTGRELAVLRGHKQAVSAVAWDPEGRRLASGSDAGTIRLWDLDTGRELTVLRGSKHEIWSVAWHPEGRSLASASDDGTVRLWDPHTGHELSVLEGHEQGVRAVAWHPKGLCLASASDDSTVRLWSPHTKHELFVLRGHKDRVNSIAWHPEGSRLASASEDGTIRLWDPGTGRELSVLRGHEHGVRAVAWHPEGSSLASASEDGTIRLWDPDTGRELSVLRGHEHGVRVVAWHPEGRCLASASKDGTIRLWDPDTGRELSVLRGHERTLRTVAWAPKGNRLASASADGPIRLWGGKTPEQYSFLALLSAMGDTYVARTPHGFFIANGDASGRIVLALSSPGKHSHAQLYLPLAGLREVLHRPDKVAAALSGDLSGDSPWAALEQLGMGGGRAWSGEPEPITPSRTQPLPNPFRPGPALTDSPRLPGREAALADLLALIKNRSPAVLRGPRRAGKTSLLHGLAQRLASTHQIRHITLEARHITTDDDLARVLEPSLASDPRPAATLRARLREETAAVLLLDEIANLLTADASVFAWLRAVGQERTSVVLVGSHWDWVQVVEHAASAPGSSFGNDVTPVTLGALSEADALDFLEKTAPPDVPLLSTGAGRWIVERCGSWPFYLQVMGHSVIQAVRAGERRALVEPSGMTELYENRLLVDRDVGYFRARWKELPERARAVLRRVPGSADGSLPAVKSLSPEERKVLRDTGLCDPFGRWLEDKPFYDWLRRIADDDLGRN